MKLKRTLLSLMPVIAIAICPRASAAILWTAGTTGDASGSWDGTASTFNGQAYTTVDDLDIDGTAAKTITLSGTVPTPNSLTVSSTGNVVLTGSSLDGSLSKPGAASVLTLSSANTLGTVAISGGKFILANQAALGTSGTLTVNAGTAVRSTSTSYPGAGASEFFFDTTTLTTSGTVAKNSAITPATSAIYGFVIKGASSLTNTLTGNITGGSAVTLWMDSSTASDSTSGWSLGGNNSGFAGIIRLNRGVLTLGNANAGGTGTIFLQTNPNASGNLVLNGAFTLGTAITFGSIAGDVISAGANDAVLSGTLTGTSTWAKAGAGKLTLTNTVNASTGTITVSAGTLAIGGAGRLNSGTTAGGLALTTTGSTFDYGSTAAQTITGTVSGTGKLTKSGTGTLTLSATTNTFSGGITVSAGTLGIISAGSAGTGPILANSSYGTTYASAGAPFLFVNNTTATVLSNAIVVPSPGTTQYYAIQKATGATGTLELSGLISGGSATSVLQLDTPTAGDSATGYIISGNGNTLAGTIRLNRGNVTLTNANAAGTATIFLQSNVNAAGNLRFSNSFTLPNAITFGVTANNTISTGANSVTLSGSVTSGVAFGKAGTGTLTLTNAANPVTGAITVADGTLALGGAGQLNSGTFAAGLVLTATTSTFSYGSSAAQTLSGIISGAGGVTKSGGSALTLSGVNTYTGNTTVTGGTLILTQPALSDSGDVYLSTGGVLELDTAATDSIRTLYLNGVAQVAGEWGGTGSGAAHTTPLITGAGKLLVTGATFGTWAGSHGLTGANAAFDADPDHDGIKNGIEFVIGGEPNGANPGSNSNALLPAVSTSGSNFIITWTRTDDSAYLNPVIQFSTDLASWATAVNGTNATITTVDGSPSDTITVTIPKGANTKMFARLFVTMP